jgi:hypothetical protein
MVNATSTMPTDVNEEIRHKPRRPWVKVDVDEDTFLVMHDSANKSRMRVSTYIRTLLNDANVYHDDGVPFESPSVSATAS